MIVTAEQFVPGSEPGVAPAPAALLRPDATTLFARRAARLRQLAEGHEMEDFFVFLAGLMDIQQDLATMSGEWQEVLPQLLARAVSLPAPPPVAAAIAELEREGECTARVDRWLAGEPRPEDLAGSSFITAALQVARTHRAATAEPSGHDAGCCPLCGGAPVAATISTLGGIAGLRHLHCGLCGTAWHLERVSCAQCRAEDKLIYHRLDGYEPVVKAETCGACGTYVKVFDTDAWPGIEPLADDMASFALDLLLAEQGLRRLWPNPFLHGA